MTGPGPQGGEPERDAPLPRDPTPTQAVRTVAQEMRARRISFVMVFRLAILLVAAVFAGLTANQSHGEEDVYHFVIWTTLALGFLLTIVFAWMLPRSRRLESFAFAQSAIDLSLSATLVQLTGGIESGFVFLYMVTVLGAALMGTRGQTFAATGAACIIYTALASLQLAGVSEPVYPPGLDPNRDGTELLVAMGRSIGAIGIMGLLAGQLSHLLSSSGEEVLNLRALNQHIVSSLASGLATIDPERRVVVMNPQANRLLSLETGSFIGKPANEVFPGLQAELERATDREHRFELSRMVDGEKKRLGCSLGPLRGGHGEALGWVLHFQDITDLRKLEQDSRRKERLTAVGRLAASVAHEVRNPLAAMAGSAELIATAELDDDDQRLLKIIQREAARLDRLVSDLLSFTTPRPLELVETNLAALVSETIESFQADPSSSDLEVEVDVPEVMNAWIDSGAMAQVVWNLLRNASMATSHSGSILVRVYPRHSRRIVEIIDDGPGLPPERREVVFEPFESSTQGGFGFGLALVRRLIRDHGGEVSILEREDGRSGARLHIDLPSRRPPPATGLSLPPPDSQI